MDTTHTSSADSPLSALKYAAGTDIGKKREENQDSFGVIEGEGFRLYIVADGMGGVKGGAIASNLAVKTIQEELRSKTELTVPAVVAAAQLANTRIHEKGNEEGGMAGMGTTLTGVAFVGRSLYLVNVGDSRIYRFRNGRLKQLSEDHTLVRELIRNGTLNEDQAENHPVAHMLTRSLGPTPDIEVDCWYCDDGPARGDVYLLCSDGLYNMVTERALVEILSENSLDQSIQKCIDLANERGGADNITLILVQVGESFPLGIEDFPEEVGEGVEDTVEIQADDLPDSGASSHENGESQAENGNLSDSPELHGGMSFSKVANVSGSQEYSDHAADAGDELPGFNLKKGPANKPQLQMGLSVLLIGILIGVGGAWIWAGSRSEPEGLELLSGHVPVSSTESQVVVPLPEQAVLSHVDVFLPDSVGAPILRSALPDMDPIGVEHVDSEEVRNLSGDLSGSLSQHDLDNVKSRKVEVRDFLNSIEQKLEAIDRPISGRMGELLQATTRERESYKSKINDIQIEMDGAARKLAVWYGRQKRLQTTDPINLASEVSVSSEAVKEKKEIFERATWAYLQENEIWRYNPTDNKQDEKVKELLKVRKQRMIDLAAEVKDAIEREVKSADQRIAELTLDRDQLQSKINALDQDVQYIQVIMGGDVRAKDRVRKELIHKQELAREELNELGKVLPD